MSFWSGIKYALNSTLGTEKFQTLDDIVHKQFTIIASDDIYDSFDNLALEETFTTPEDNGITKNVNGTLFSVRMTKYGTIRIPYGISLSQANNTTNVTLSTTGTISIFQNGVSVASKSYQANTNSGMNSYTDSFDIPVSPGDIITAELSMQAYFSSSLSSSKIARVSIYNLSICGTLKNSFYTKLE